MEFLVIPQSTRSLIECYSAGGDCDCYQGTLNCTTINVDGDDNDICACKGSNICACDESKTCSYSPCVERVCPARKCLIKAEIMNEL